MTVPFEEIRIPSRDIPTLYETYGMISQFFPRNILLCRGGIFDGKNYSETE